MMNEKGVYDYMGESGFCWFHGIVEDILDPLELGRVRVRCFGFHSTSKKDIPTEHLPWALVLQSCDSASVSGIGKSPHALVQGSQVIGFFRDGTKAQHPVIMGTILSLPEVAANPEKGFNDPDGVYPRSDRLGQSDVNQLSRESHLESPVRQSRTENLVSGVNTASGKTWGEPDSGANVVYPHNRVVETESGHIVEFDDTPDSERIHIRHKSGSYHEILPDGSVSTKTVSGKTEIVQNDNNLLVSGDLNINVEKDSDIKINDNLTIQIVQGNIKIRVEGGNADVFVQGDCQTTVGGNLQANVSKDTNIETDGKTLIKSGGEIRIESDSNVTIRGSTIRLN